MTIVLRSPADQNRRWCDLCAGEYQLLRHEIERGNLLYALTFTACHHHDGRHEAWIQAVLGDFATDDDDTVKFGCRIGPIDGLRDPAAGLVDAAWLENGEVFGRALTRPEALEHPWIIAFWEVVDLVLAEEPIVRRHLYAPH